MNNCINDIRIHPALNGFYCQVGCQKIVFESRAALLTNLARYLENPAAVEAEFRKNAVNPSSPLPQPVSPEQYTVGGINTARTTQAAAEVNGIIRDIAPKPCPPEPAMGNYAHR